MTDRLYNLRTKMALRIEQANAKAMVNSPQGMTPSADMPVEEAIIELIDLHLREERLRKRRRFRSAVTGKFVPKREVLQNPNETTIENKDGPSTKPT